MNKKSDGEIKEHVLRELKWDSRTTWSEIGVEVFEGVVTLTGTVDSYAKKRVAAATPFGFMRRFATDMERLFEEFEGFRFPSLFGREFFPFTREFEHVGWVPEIEVLRKNGEFIVRADLPGLKREDVKVELTEGLLTISGERKEEKEEKREGYYRSERSYGSFFRQIPLPEGAKTDTAKAEFNDGVLEITMQVPVREPQKRLLEIKQGEHAAKAKAAAAK